MEQGSFEPSKSQFSYQHAIFDEHNHLIEVRIRRYDLDHMAVYNNYFKKHERYHFEKGKVELFEEQAPFPLQAEEAREEFNFFWTSYHVDVGPLPSETSEFVMDLQAVMQSMIDEWKSQGN